MDNRIITIRPGYLNILFLLFWVSVPLFLIYKALYFFVLQHWYEVTLSKDEKFLLLSCPVLIGIAVYIINMMLCKVIIFDNKILYKTLFSTKKIEISNIVQAKPSLSNARGSGSFYIRGENKTISLANISFSSEKIKLIKSILISCGKEAVIGR